MKKYENPATATAASGELEDDRPPAKRKKLQVDAAQIVDELLAGIRPNLTSDGESMGAHHSDDSGYGSGDGETIAVLTAKVPSQLPPPPQRPNTPSKALQRPTTLALNTVFQTCHITRIAITISTESSRQEAQRLHRHSESWRRRSTNKTSIGYNLCTSDHSSTKRCDQN